MNDLQMNDLQMNDAEHGMEWVESFEDNMVQIFRCPLCSRVVYIRTQPWQITTLWYGDISSHRDDIFVSDGKTIQVVKGG